MIKSLRRRSLMRGRHIPRVFFSIVGAVTVGCAPSQITTVTIFETPSAFVRIETDRTVDPDHGHTHPANLPPEVLAAVWSGIKFDEPLAKMPIYDDLSQPRHHSAFTEREISFFAPLLSVALSRAMPEELVTFYQTRDVSRTGREVTSGGLFVQGEELHVIIGNYRSPTNFMADVGVTDTTDDRLVPMRAIAPQRGRLYFDPPAATRDVDTHALGKIFQRDRRELIILYGAVSPVVPTPGTPIPDDQKK